MLLHEEITNTIIKCFYKVYNELGFGFLEKVYENAMLIELMSHELTVSRQVPVEVFYLGKLVDNYFVDITVEDIIIIELKPEKEDWLKNINYN